MKRNLTSELSKLVGQQVLIKGWYHQLRSLGKINFLIVRDRGGYLQVVIEDKSEFTKIKDLQPGSILTIKGKVQKTDQTELGCELIEPEITVEEPISEIIPVEYNKDEIRADLDTILDYRPITLRNRKIQAIFKVQAAIMKAFGDSMRRQGFTEFKSPVLIGVPSESGADVFEVNYFDQKAFLAQSPQIYKQIMVGVFERAFTIATVFRAEKHNTSRHLMEITQMDGEMGFIESYEDALEVIEDTVRDIIGYLDQNYSQEFKLWNTELPKLPEGKFPRIKVKQALQIIEERTGKSAKREELDVDPEDEREIGKWALEKYNSDFLFLTNFKKNKNFYTWNNPEDPDESISYDLECRGLEWLSGTHRIHKYDELLKRLKKQGLNEENYDHYLQAFRYGIPSEAGFSFGLERMTQQIFNLKNIREATLFPSDLKRVSAGRIRRKIYFGAENIRNEIVRRLKDAEMQYTHQEHEPTPTSADSAKMRGTKPEEGIKAIILIGKKSKQNFQFNIPSHKKMDMKKVSEILGEKCEFEDPEIIKKRFGIVIGGVPPFGNLLGLKTYFDASIQNEKRSAFNCGMQTESIIMDSKDLISLVEPEIADFAKE